MGFLTNLNKIRKEIKGGFVDGQMSSAIKYTMYDSTNLSESSTTNTTHEGENFYFDKFDSYIIREEKNGEVEKFKILEVIDQNTDTEIGKTYKTLKGSDIYTFKVKFAIPGVMNFLKITSSSEDWNPFEGQVTHVVNV